MVKGEHPHAFDTSRAEKQEAYTTTIPLAGYPLLYAMILDMQQTQALRPQAGSLTSEARTDIGIKKLFLGRQEVYSRVGNLPLMACSSEVAFNVGGESAKDPRKQSTSDFFYAAPTIDDLRVFTQGHNALITLCQAFYDKHSFTYKVSNQLIKAHPEANQAVQLGTMRRTLHDGFLSTYEAAVFLSTIPTPHSPEDAYKRLIEVLESDAPLQLTRRVKLNVLTILGQLNFSPVNKLFARDGKLQLHPDTETFIQAVNDSIKSAVRHDFPCPFAAPLGKKIEDALAYYGGEKRLPQEVVAMMRNESQTSGITSAGRAIAEAFQGRRKRGTAQ